MSDEYTTLDDNQVSENQRLNDFTATSYVKKRRNAFIISFAIGCVVVVAAVVVILSIALTSQSGSKKLPDDPVERAKALTQKYPLIDGHNDTPWRIRELFRNQLSTVNLNENQPDMDTDIPRLREGGVGGQIWSVYVDCGKQWKDAVRATLEQVDLTERMIKAYPDTFMKALTADDIEKAFKEKKIASLMGMEG